MHFDSNISILTAVTCAVGYVMTVAGLRKRALELKRRQRHCPSCGRIIEAGVCSACNI